MTLCQLAASAVLALSAHTGGPTTHDVALELDERGVLHVTERITHDFGAGGEITRTVLTRAQHDDVHDRLYHIANVTGPGPVEDDRLTISGKGRQTITVSYDVTGAVTPHGEVEEMRWFAAGGLSVPVSSATVTVTGPERLQGLSCFAGALTSAIGCTSATMDHHRSAATFRQRGLGPGQVLTVVAAYPRYASGATPILDRRFDLSESFDVNPVTGAALAVLLALLLGGAAFLRWTAGRDARVGRREGRPVVGPPEGVRPGQIGTLLDERANVVDVTATIVDLAVRGHLAVEETAREIYDAPDWLLVKRSAEGLVPYERALFTAIFAERDSVRISELGGTLAGRLGEVRDALYADMVGRGWFAHRPDAVRTPWTALGVALTAVGVPAAVALAWLTPYGLLGLAVIIGGAALTAGARHMPARSRAGSDARGQAEAFRDYLTSGAETAGLADEERTALFARHLPYAVAFDALDAWTRMLPASTSGDGAGSAAGDGAGSAPGAVARGVAWYRGPAGWDGSRLPASLRAFTLTVSGALAGTRQLR
ncbi:Predicted membrane protein [Sinosporangium album]|uniref:Predicted membrane protein n=1 Tax=Sinosporangium album TaxID=504805 RepID=A0A1G8JYF4_9ACTN|nr:DUF2207 domain-containing protein [Sinosporangium album]SDI36214.1 Predicted membrane protein [Sinosporangium album]